MNQVIPGMNRNLLTICWKKKKNPLRGKPKKNAFIINKARTMFPFAIIWLLVDSIVIYAFINDPEAMKFRL